MSSDPGSTEEPVLVGVADAVATITLNRPKRLNAYTDGPGRRLR
jgi:enoyl-CoA hydratase/carnithine racemase